MAASADPHKDDNPDDLGYEAHIEAIAEAMPPLRPELIARLSALFDWPPQDGAA